MSDSNFVERRCADRQKMERHVTLLIESDRTNAHRQAVTLDLCALGARVRTDVSLTPGQSIDVILNEKVPHIFPAQVIWVNAIASEGPREAGLSFTDPQKVPRAVLSSPGLQH